MCRIRLMTQLLVSCFFLPVMAIAQISNGIVNLNDSSVYFVPPPGFEETSIYKGVRNENTGSTIYAFEEPIESYAIWKPRFTSVERAKAFSDQDGSQFVGLFEIEVNGKIVPIMETKREGTFRSGITLKALYEAENSVVLVASIYDATESEREAVIESFRSVEINVETPLELFADSGFRVELISPFTFAIAGSDDAFLKSYPEIDSRYRKPSIGIGYKPIYEGDLEPDPEISVVAGYLFPAMSYFFDDDDPSYEKVHYVGFGEEEIGPGAAFRLEATYENRMGIQYVWDVGAEEYLVLFAVGETELLKPLKPQVEAIAKSLTLHPKE